MKMTRTDLAIAHARTRTHARTLTWRSHAPTRRSLTCTRTPPDASPASVEGPASCGGVTSNSHLIPRKGRPRASSGFSPLCLRLEPMWGPPPHLPCSPPSAAQCHFSATPASGTGPLPPQSPLGPPLCGGQASSLSAARPRAPQRRGTPARRCGPQPGPASCGRVGGRGPSPARLRQEAGRGQGRHSNWGRWFCQEEVDSSTSNTDDAGPTLPAPLSHPCPRRPAPPLLPERETREPDTLRPQVPSLARLRQEEAAPMGSQQPPLAALYLLGVLGEYPAWGMYRVLGLRGAREKMPVVVLV